MTENLNQRLSFLKIFTDKEMIHDIWYYELIIHTPFCIVCNFYSFSIPRVHMICVAE